jgi:orotidine-5'-phosphate decarboxylase
VVEGGGTAAVTEPRDVLALGLDVGDLTVALQLSSRLRPWFSVAKVGLELFTAAGPAAVEGLVEDGWAVFLDLKLHDIPNTVGRAATQAGALGATYLTAHAAGGEAMLRAAVDGFGEGVLGVTVLTSAPEAPAELVASRAALAARAGCTGAVCAGSDLVTVAAAAPDLMTVVPGIRLAGAPTNDQARVATPAEALSNGARLLVIGRTVTAAANPELAAAKVASEVGQALG